MFFLLIFSFLLLSEFTFKKLNDCTNSTNSSLNITFANQTVIICEKMIIKQPIWIEYLLIVWVFSLMCHEISQVNQFEQFLKF